MNVLRKDLDNMAFLSEDRRNLMASVEDLRSSPASGHATLSILLVQT